MLKKILYLNLILLIVSCNGSREMTRDSAYYRSSADSIHAQNIQKNLIPMYSIAGNVQRMTIPEMMKQDNIPGMSIAFVENGEIAWTKHYGYANLEDSLPITSETVFTGASLSKPITAIAALNLVEKGHLNLDENVNLKLKEWKIPETNLTENEKVTLKRLISHNAGIKNDLWGSYLPEETVPTINQMLAGEKPSVDPQTSVTYEPGSKTEYSNPGYSIIQKLLMDVRNEEFDQIIDQLVFDPVGMENSSFKQPIPTNLMKRKAIGYTIELEPYPYRLFPYQAAGGIWTTPTDLAQFMITLLDDYHKGTNTLVSKEMAQTIFKKNIARYVFSLWNWGEDIVFMHYGSNQGFNCIMYGSIEKNQGIVVMTNSDNSFGFFDYIQRAVNNEYQWEYVKPEILNPTESDISWVDSFLGEYQWRNNNIIFTKDNKNLILQIENVDYVLTQTGERVFVLADKTIKITFSDDSDSRITIWEPNGYPFRIKKIIE
ncbi:CubicO group peptidase (beta-lactamase class C family) [Ulvibacter sp. MAR_2010_11]|uniref:serine hydrolase domain-containing protein n=1 Tax=Ulvibacter sp. MAR_2010_11 TaxID=1250229 RepID=UPI000C2B7216|nr:serine hydrolase domain-containing protein [Ulvibacter sp. MAR_2010_11]PKA81981.1 CubicO group peptidase (beta-lactamase class C family) [Ulvibacter sp. MAR_2010_11]